MPRTMSAVPPVPRMSPVRVFGSASAAVDAALHHGGCRRRPAGMPRRVPEPLDQHAGRFDHGEGIGDALAGDVGRRAVRRLRHGDARRSPMHSPGAMPSPPTRPAASSVRMSPNMLVVTTTSKLCGSRTRRIAMVSTITSSTVDVRKLRADLVALLDEHAAAELEDGVLVDERQPLRGAAARSRSAAARHLAAALPRDDAHRDRHVLGRAELARARDDVAVGLKALVVLAHDDEVDVVVEAADARDRSASAGHWRTDRSACAGSDAG